MRYLLDTHVLLWSQAEPERLGKKAREVLLESKSVLLFSPMSTLEISRLAVTAKITLGLALQEYIVRLVASLKLETIPFSHEVAMEAYALPGEFHTDPADRVLVASARVSSAVLLTADERIVAYPHVRTLHASR